MLLFLTETIAPLAFALKDGGRVELHRVDAGRLEPVPLLGEDVQQHGALEVLHQLEIAPQARQVVAVDRADVAKAHFLEQHAAVEERFDRVFEVPQHRLGRLAEGQLVEQPGNVALEPVIKRSDAGLVEIVRQSADAGADPHLVVVEDHDHVFFETGRVVHRLEDDARRQRAIAQHGHGPAILSQQIVTRLEAQHGRNARTGVARHEQVVGAFLGIGVTHQSAFLADRAEVPEATGEQLVRIDLVAGVPDQAVFGEVEDQVQGDGQLHHAQVAGKVGRPSRHHVAQGFANLGGQPS